MRVLAEAIGLTFLWQGMKLSLFIKWTRNEWTILETRPDAELRRYGIVVFLLGIAVLACVI
jgi:uncharacterized protein YjeT (DUF2065 family)